MDDADLNRVLENLAWHAKCERRDQMKSEGVAKSYVEFSKEALPLMLAAGLIYFDTGKNIPGEAARNKKELRLKSAGCD